MFTSCGKLRYSKPEDKFKLIVEVDRGIGAFYRSLIPKYYRSHPQKYPPHISVVRNEKPKNLNFWDKYEGCKINFEYDSFIFNNNTYFWLDVYSDDLVKIRKELGLNSKYISHPNGKSRDTFHITLANTKD